MDKLVDIAVTDAKWVSTPSMVDSPMASLSEGPEPCGGSAVLQARFSASPEGWNKVQAQRSRECGLLHLCSSS